MFLENIFAMDKKGDAISIVILTLVIMVPVIMTLAIMLQVMLTLVIMVPFRMTLVIMVPVILTLVITVQNDTSYSGVQLVLYTNILLS